MDKLEKVIQAFENCMAPEMNDDETFVDCTRAGECPWDDCQERGRKLIDIPLSLAMAALELLKAQEARVMTLEEVVSAECVWIEYAVGGNVIIAFPWNIELTDDTYNFICNPNCIVEFRSLYGKEWRCWTSRPTDEQRKAVKWDE